MSKGCGSKSGGSIVECQNEIGGRTRLYMYCVVMRDNEIVDSRVIWNGVRDVELFARIVGCCLGGKMMSSG